MFLRTMRCLFLTLPGIASCGIFITYSAEPIELYLVDSVTQKPVEGAVVVAHWEQKGGLEGGNVIGHLMIQEAVSDNNGRVSFPAWGPESGAPPSSGSPHFIIFKPGYQYTARGNTGRRPRDLLRAEDGRLTSMWKGREIQLVRFEEEKKKYRREVIRYSDELHSVIEDCGWKYIPQMMAELTRFCKKNNCWLSYEVDIRKWNEAHNENKDWYSRVENRCGISPVEFFKEYYYE